MHAFRSADAAIPPGGSTTVKLEWTAKSDNGPFRQSATILTNDPRHSQIDLAVDGQILAISGVEPPDFFSINFQSAKSNRRTCM